MEKLNEKIQDYLDGTLTAAEEQAFETALATDKNLANEVELYSDLIKGIEIGADDTLRQSISTVKNRLAAENFFNTTEEVKKEAIIRTLPNANAAENTGKIRRLSIYKWAVAASVLLVVGIAYWLMQDKNPVRFQEAYAQHFTVDKQHLGQLKEELNSTSFVVDKIQNASLVNALNTYEKQDYTKAKSLLQGHLTQYPDDFNAQFYLAMTLMGLKDNQNAVVPLKNLTNNADWSKTAQWYLALNYLTMDGKQAAALQLLEIISQTADSPYSAEAGEMLKKLK